MPDLTTTPGNDHPVPRQADGDEPAESSGRALRPLPGPADERMEIRAGAMRLAATFEPPMVSIDGDLDAAALPALVASLAKVVHHGRGDVRVDVAKLRRADVGALRALVTSASNLHRDGRRLVLHAVAPWLLALLIVTGWDDTPGLRVVPDPLPAS
ncbi:MAG: STAS domain-containing protein [Frankia sp.]|nr:STAS domain-containing protein [Frankia sp.]